MVVETTSPVWRTDALAVVLHPHIKGTVGRPWNGGGRPTHQWEMYRYGGGDHVAWCGHLELNQDSKGSMVLWLYL